MSLITPPASLRSFSSVENVRIFGIQNNSLRPLLSTPPLPWRDIFLYLSSSLQEAITIGYTLVIWKDANCEKFEIRSMMTELTNGNYILLPDNNIELSLCVENFINISRSTIGSEILTASGDSDVDSTPEPEKHPEPGKKPLRGNLFRKEVRKKCNECAFCGNSSQEHLESAHIVDQHNATMLQSVESVIKKLEMGINNTENGILLCANCHLSFGHGKIAMYQLDNDYIMLVLVNSLTSPFHLKPINVAFNDIHPELVIANFICKTVLLVI